MKTPYRVGSDVDALFLTVLDQVVALQSGMALNLVGGRHDTSGVDDGLELWIMVSMSMTLRVGLVEAPTWGIR